MTALTANPPLLLHPLADRHGVPAALLLDFCVPVVEDTAAGAAADAAADAAVVVPPTLPAALAVPATRALPPTLALPPAMLRDLAAGGMRCFYRNGLPGPASEALQQAGWQALDPATLHRMEHPQPAASAPGPGVLWLAGDWFMVPPPKPVGVQVASRALALQLVQLVATDADTHEIEAVLRQDPTLSYHLLRLVNSLGLGAGRRVTSFSQAILILGRAQLRRWLNLMLFSSREGDRRSPMLLARVSVRARAMELLAHDTGLNKNQQEMAFMVGMFSLLGVLFGMPLADVLKPLTVSEAIARALLDHDGELGQLLMVVEAAERDDHAALAHQLGAINIDGDQCNRIMVDAYMWMQSVALGKTAPPTKAAQTGAHHA